MRAIAILAAAACSSSPRAVPAPPKHDAAPPPAVRIRSLDRTLGGYLRLHAAAGTPDGGVIVVGSSLGSIEAGGMTACVSYQGGMFIVRIDPTGVVRGIACIADPPLGSRVAVTEAGMWIARKVPPEAPEHTHGAIHDLLAVDRVTLDGRTIDTRIVATWNTSGETSPELAASVARSASDHVTLTAAVAAGDQLVIAGSTMTARLVDGRWEGSGVDTSLHGFVLAIPPTGRVRAIVDAPAAQIDSVAIRGDRYAAAGFCTTMDPSVPRFSACGTQDFTDFVVDGKVDGTGVPRVHTVDNESYGLHVIIDGTGAVALAGLAWRDPIVIEGTTVRSGCGAMAFAAAWAADGSLRYARPVGDCERPRDRRVPRTLEVVDAVAIDGAPVVAVRAEGARNGGEGPVRFDDKTFAVGFSYEAFVVALDRGGAIAWVDQLHSIGAPERSGQPDGSLSGGAGVQDVIPIEAGPRTWLVVHHAGGLRYENRRFLGETRLRSDDEVVERDPATGERVHRECTVEAIRDAPFDDDGRYTATDAECRERVAIEESISVIARAAR